ncbi:hypothetical protein G7K_3812-t1 [Saitoella complicata NRRL Y-17804]|uniref:Uncharacterized protein n=1 Tax=Saitoella complicata (strain BCRC 22490 / CBS 7301 / JCM 7358 / NBRC 10748 / NRRL Y-17804) TaxID=698492 RepID=A0A0E9NJT3_SAICN|nr:hypothetical protein G7K_3812-t1 [Saitoella complicata NRRL Y-17804]
MSSKTIEPSRNPQHKSFGLPPASRFISASALRIRDITLPADHRLAYSPLCSTIQPDSHPSPPQHSN